MDTGLNNTNRLHEIFQNKDFEDIEWLIEANSNEQHQIWEGWHTKLKWEQINPGFSYTIKRLSVEGEELPICLCFTFAKVNGRKIAFYECSSLLSHYGYIEVFLKTYFQRTHDNYCRWNQVDAKNAHNCLNYLETIDKEPRDTKYTPQGYMKKYFVFE
jgi:hypothetical protein